MTRRPSTLLVRPEDREELRRWFERDRVDRIATLLNGTQSDPLVQRCAEFGLFARTARRLQDLLGEHARAADLLRAPETWDVLPMPAFEALLDAFIGFTTDASRRFGPGRAGRGDRYRWVVLRFYADWPRLRSLGVDLRDPAPANEAVLRILLQGLDRLHGHQPRDYDKLSGIRARLRRSTKPPSKKHESR